MQMQNEYDSHYNMLPWWIRHYGAKNTLVTPKHRWDKLGYMNPRGLVKFEYPNTITGAKMLYNKILENKYVEFHWKEWATPQVINQNAFIRIKTKWKRNFH